MEAHLNRHFVEMLRELSAAGAELLIVGAHALAAHGYVRGTVDFDIWIRPTQANAERVMRALVNFGAPLLDLTVDDCARPDTIYQIGVEPLRIDIITSITAVEFDDAWASRLMTRIDGEEYPVIGKADLIRNKRATGRLKDLADVEELERM
ncbi:MAG TPA: hypothetical protein VEZ11_04020 [Thermoanaerobaculia bacterium]|nr:hypothetical protein [Thermoanaerobaculia bacterium]